jgi:hypothetical protein
MLKQSPHSLLEITSTSKSRLLRFACQGRWSLNDRLANFPTGSKSFKKLCGLCGHLHVLCAVLGGENLCPNYTGVISL